MNNLQQQQLRLLQTILFMVDVIVIGGITLTLCVGASIMINVQRIAELSRLLN